MKKFINVIFTTIIGAIISISGLVIIVSIWSMFTGYFGLISVLSFVVSTIIFILTASYLTKIKGGWRQFFDNFPWLGF